MDTPAAPALPTVAELVELGESLDVEFKSSLWYSHMPDVPEKVIVESVAKTVAAFLNTSGGTLAIGVADDGSILGLAHDLDHKRMDLDKFENALQTILLNAVGTVAATRCKTRFETVGDKVVSLVDVEAASKPVYATGEKGKAAFYVRAGNTTRLLDTKETVEYIQDRWGVG
jgi:predicted HTH transcriptional regulator